MFKRVTLLAVVFLFFSLVAYPQYHVPAEARQQMTKRYEDYKKAIKIAGGKRVIDGNLTTFLGFRFGMTEKEVETHIDELIKEEKLTPERKYCLLYVSTPFSQYIEQCLGDLFFVYHEGKVYKMGIEFSGKATDKVVPLSTLVNTIQGPLVKRGYEEFNYLIGEKPYDSFLLDNVLVSFSEEDYSMPEDRKTKQENRFNTPTRKRVKVIYTDIYIESSIIKEKNRGIQETLNGLYDDF